jgi:hypothetical protein
LAATRPGQEDVKTIHIPGPVCPSGPGDSDDGRLLIQDSNDPLIICNCSIWGHDRSFRPGMGRDARQFTAWFFISCNHISMLCFISPIPEM